jgi:hypothetical protein
LIAESFSAFISKIPTLRLFFNYSLVLLEFLGEGIISNTPQKRVPAIASQ